VGLNALTVVGSDLTVNNNANLASLATLGNVVSTGGRVLVQNNPLLAGIGMNALTTVGSELRIEGNAALTSLAPMNSLVSTVNAVRIKNNPQLIEHRPARAHPCRRRSRDRRQRGADLTGGAGFGRPVR
jgi:hypothetical protein